MTQDDLERFKVMQCGAHFSDEEVGRRVRMLMRTDIEHEAVCCMARDRIRYLSAALEVRHEELQRVYALASHWHGESDSIRLQTARECAEIADAENASGRGGNSIREKFGLTVEGEPKA